MLRGGFCYHYSPVVLGPVGSSAADEQLILLLEKPPPPHLGLSSLDPKGWGGGGIQPPALTVGLSKWLTPPRASFVFSSVKWAQ